MAERMIGISVAITRYVSDDPQPGVVACEFSDAYGRCWDFVEKTAIVSAEYLDAQTSYPQPGILACEIVSRHWDSGGREIILIDTERPWGVESTEGNTRFEVWPTSLIEWEWSHDDQKAWTGVAKQTPL